MNPRVSIVIEAYNEEQNALAPPIDTLRALRRQPFPMELVELVLIGSPEQIECWDHFHPEFEGFGWVRLLPVDSSRSHYWELKNQGAAAATAPLVAFIDCDALPGPEWLPALVSALENGADVSVGPSLYRSPKLGAESPWMQAVSLPSWSFILAGASSAETPREGALAAHNLGIRRELALAHPFVTLHRSFCSSLLFFELKRAGARFSYNPGQRVAHGWNFRWWLGRMHFRRGWETWEGRSLDPDWPRMPLLEALKYIEPLVLRTALICRDTCHWLRFGRVIGLSRGRVLLLWPLAVCASATARAAETVGMYAGLLAPRSTAWQARF